MAPRCPSWPTITLATMRPSSRPTSTSEPGLPRAKAISCAGLFQGRVSPQACHSAMTAASSPFAIGLIVRLISLIARSCSRTNRHFCTCWESHVANSKEHFILLTDERAAELSRLVLVSINHIVEVRPQGNPISEGAIVILSDGRTIETADTFDKIAQ